MLDRSSFDQHERVVLAHDAATGLQAVDSDEAVTRKATAQDGARLHSAGVLCAPNYRIPVRLTKICTRSSALDRPTSELADGMARQLLAEAR